MNALKEKISIYASWIFFQHKINIDNDVLYKLQAPHKNKPSVSHNLTWICNHYWNEP